MADAQDTSKLERININYEGTLPYPGIDHLGRCYDFIKMDPFDLSARVRDGGGGMAGRAIDIPANLVKVECSDQSVYIPPGTKLDSESRGMRSSRAETWFDSTELSSSFEKTVSSGLSIPGLVSFSQSSTYSEFNKTTSTNEKMETFVQSYFEDCHIGFLKNVHEHLPINAEFAGAVGALKTQDDCTKFIQKFGTHYAHEITFGGRMYQRIRIDTKTYRNLKESGKDVSTSAEGTYKKATVKAGSSSSSSSSSAFESNSNVSVEDIKWVGGTPHTNFDDWVQTIRKDPKPVQMELRPVYELFTSNYFKSDSKIADKKKLMEKAVTDYIKANAYIKPALQELANKKFHFINRWRADIGERRVDMHLSYQGNSLELYGKNNTTDLTPWLLVPVPNTVDQFYIQNKWKESENERRLDMYIGFSGDNIVLTGKSDHENLTPWRFIPVPNRPGEYYVRSRWKAEQGDRRTDYHMAFTGDNVELYHKDNRYDLTPWKLVPVTG
ncbi:MAC/perforin domain-containing protein [Myxococcus hansupus]|nr:MAC/perforin domain-containing protein [Myxococcus hansupus]